MTPPNPLNVHFPGDHGHAYRRWLEACHQPQSPHPLSVREPATGQLLAQITTHDAATVELAIERASMAMSAWQAQGVHARAKRLRNWYQAIQNEKISLAQLVSLETGKPYQDALQEIDYAASFVRWFAEIGPQQLGHTLPAPSPSQRLLCHWRPVGVVAAITPWNFPAAMVTRKVAPALMAGCPVVLKPDDRTPLTALALAALAHESGLPQALFQVVNGAAETIVHPMLRHSSVRKISFTGSTRVGKALMQAAAHDLKRLSLELGGHAPVLVFEDADVHAAVHGIVQAKIRNAGQACIAANRVLVHHSLVEALQQELVQALQNIKLGPAWEEGVAMGPIINLQAAERIRAQIEDACRHGAKLLCGGAQVTALGPAFIPPTLLRDPGPDARILHEETFGPALTLQTFWDEAQALRLANSTAMGLGAYVYTHDGARQWRVGEALRVGMVGFNTTQISNPALPFGGVGHSGFGREGSPWGLEEYMERQAWVMQI